MRPLRETVTPALGCLGQEFTPDSLACLAMTSKDERLLCGPLARRLRGEFADDVATLVRIGANGRHRPTRAKRVEVAVLQPGKPVELIGVKAPMSFGLVKRTARGFPVRAVVGGH